MNLVTVNLDTIRIGQPLLFSLWDANEILIAPKGFVINSQADLDLVVQDRTQLYMDVAESEAYRRAYVGKLRKLVTDDLALGQIAESQFSSFDLEMPRDPVITGEPDWLDLQEQTNTMLRDSNAESFCTRLDKLHLQINRHARTNPDGTLFALIHLSSRETRKYSATHAMLVSVMCSLAVREVLKWPAELEKSLCKAALTMNVGMTELQDRLALQKEPPTADQTKQIEQHAARGLSILMQRGVTDPLWLEAVVDHHTNIPGPLAARTEAQRMARVIQRADMFSARLSPRASRLPESPANAMQAIYFNENRQVDEAGAALIKATGIYSPGTFVRLASGEVASVIKRGINTTAPRVAVVINRTGMPTGELIVRDTLKPEFRIVAGVPHRDVKVQINLERLLALTKTTSADRLW